MPAQRDYPRGNLDRYVDALMEGLPDLEADIAGVNTANLSAACRAKHEELVAHLAAARLAAIDAVNLLGGSLIVAPKVGRRDQQRAAHIVPPM